MKHDSFPEGLPEEEFSQEDRDLYKKNPRFAKAVDRLIEADPDETNWRKIMHEVDPTMTGKKMYEVAESERNPVDRATYRNYIMQYRADISRAIQKEIQKGKLPASEAEKKLEEIFNGPIIPEDKEIIL